MYAGLLCHCERGRVSIGNTDNAGVTTPSAQSSGNNGPVAGSAMSIQVGPAESSPVESSPPSSSGDSVLGAPHGAGRVSILSEEERNAILAAHAAGAGASDPGARIQPHGAASPHCQLVLLKTSTTPHSNYEQIAKLKYELVIQEKFYAADEAAQRAATSLPLQQSQPSVRTPLPIFPSLRHLPDSRV